MYSFHTNFTLFYNFLILTLYIKNFYIFQLFLTFNFLNIHNRNLSIFNFLWSSINLINFYTVLFPFIIDIKRIISLSSFQRRAVYLNQNLFRTYYLLFFHFLKIQFEFSLIEKILILWLILRVDSSVGNLNRLKLNCISFIILILELHFFFICTDSLCFSINYALALKMLS